MYPFYPSFVDFPLVGYPPLTPSPDMTIYTPPPFGFNPADPFAFDAHPMSPFPFSPIADLTAPSPRINPMNFVPPPFKFPSGTSIDTPNSSSVPGPFRQKKRKDRLDSEGNEFSGNPVDLRKYNNARERVRVRDLNAAFKDLGALCSAVNKKDVVKQTNLSILNNAVQTIKELEEKIRLKNNGASQNEACVQMENSDNRRSDFRFEEARKS